MSRMRKVGLVCYLVMVVCVALLAYRKPLPTFDRLLYAVTVARLHSADTDWVIKEAYRLSPPGEYPHTAFTDGLLRRPELMLQWIPFYATRPIYIHLLDLLGLRAVSPLAYVALALLLLYWLRSPWWCMAVMLLPDVVALCRTITPDALSTFVVLAAMLLVSLKKDYWAILLLIISLGMRSDNLFFLGAILVLLAYRRRVPWYVAGVLAVAALALVLG